MQGTAGNQLHVHILCWLEQHVTGGLLCADDPAGSKLLMVMEYVEGGPIVVGNSATEKSRLPEIVAKRFFRDIILVCHACEHSLLACWPHAYVAWLPQMNCSAVSLDCLDLQENMSLAERGPLPSPTEQFLPGSGVALGDRCM